jgi:DNA-binding IclR family transcriptional regulator
MGQARETARVRASELVKEDMLVETRPILQALADYASPMTIEELAMLLEYPQEQVRRVLYWADLLGFITPEQGDRWQLNSIVSQALRD